MDSVYSIIISFCLGIGLASATGFRVFLPLFVLSLAAHFGFDLSPEWTWVGSWTAIITLGVATIVEILAYYIPWLDNILDSISIPLAGIAGTLMMALTLGGVDSEVFKWGLAIIAGGGTAATISSSTAGARLASTATTGGVGNFMVNTGETILASVLSIVSIVLPIVGFILFLVVAYYLFKIYRKLKKKRRVAAT